MPIFVAPIAGMLSDRIGARPLLVAGMALMAAGLAWIAVVTSADGRLRGSSIPAFVMAGVGMSLYFAPVANLVLSTVRRKEEGKASGVNNTIREVGGVFGVAVLASVFAAVGGYASPQAFVDGMTAAVWVGAIAVAAGRRRRGRRSRRVRTSCPTPVSLLDRGEREGAPPASWRASRTRRREPSATAGGDRRATEAARALPPGARAASARLLAA